MIKGKEIEARFPNKQDRLRFQRAQELSGPVSSYVEVIKQQQSL